MKVSSSANLSSPMTMSGRVSILKAMFLSFAKSLFCASKRVYFIVQQMYLAKEPTQLQKLYLEYVRDLQNAAPSLIPYIAAVSDCVLNNDFYAAIKNADKLVKKESELFGEALNLG